MNVFEREAGIHQGRIARDDAPAGAYVYELGHAFLRDASVNVGDFHEVKQSFIVTPGMKFLRASVVIVTPERLPVGSAWEVMVLLNGTIMVSRRLRASKRRLTLDDWQISLFSAQPAPIGNDLTFRLELV